MANSNFSFVSAGSRKWREQLRKWISRIDSYLKSMPLYKLRPYESINQDNYNHILSSYLSPKWAFKNRETIVNLI